MLCNRSEESIPVSYRPLSRSKMFLQVRFSIILRARAVQPTQEISHQIANSGKEREGVEQHAG